MEKQHEPTAQEAKEFDFFWQHLRRNRRYGQYYAAYCKAETARKDIGAVLGIDPTPDTQFEIDLDPGRNVGGLGHCINPNIEDSAKALEQLLTRRPDYFQSVLWQQARLKTSGVVAWWNQFGAWGCMWSGGTTAIRDFHGDVAEFHKLRRELDAAEANKGNGAESMQRHEYWNKRMKTFLESSPRMDFVIETSLPWRTMSTQLKKQWEAVRALRRRVGAKDVQPGRLRDWKKHLHIWDKVRKHAPSGQPRFDRKLLKRLFPSTVNKLGDDVGLNRITSAKYKRKMDALRQQVIEAFQEAESRIVAAFP